MFTLPWLEMSRFGRSALSKAAIVAILIVPTIYAGLYLTANWAPTDNLDRLDAAVVNLDTGADAPSPSRDVVMYSVRRSGPPNAHDVVCRAATSTTCSRPSPVRANEERAHEGPARPRTSTAPATHCATGVVGPCPAGSPR